jgi:hypothetical protein
MRDHQAIKTAHNEQSAQTSHLRSEDVFIRNFDTQRSYDLTVRIRDAEGIVFANRYYLTPGRTEHETDRLTAGKYEVIVELDGRRRRQQTCRIGSAVEDTVLVEIGNGTVSITQGLYS